MKHFQSAHAQESVCTSYLQLIDICMQLFAGELTNQNREYCKVKDDSSYLYKLNNSLVCPHQITDNRYLITTLSLHSTKI